MTRAKKAKQAQLNELLMTARAIAMHYLEHCLQRGEVPRERCVEPGTGISFDNGVTVPVVLLNKLINASGAYAGKPLMRAAPGDDAAEQPTIVPVPFPPVGWMRTMDHARREFDARPHRPALVMTDDLVGATPLAEAGQDC